MGSLARAPSAAIREWTAVVREASVAGLSCSRGGDDEGEGEGWEQSCFAVGEGARRSSMRVMIRPFRAATTLPEDCDVTLMLDHAVVELGTRRI